MKLDTKIIISFLCGAILSVGIGQLNQKNTPLIPTVYAAETGQEITTDLKNCEVFFSDNRDLFEEEINKRLKGIKLLQSNVLWSETTKQIGFYALICY
ncbi:hypothetical protein [Aliikangiella sp. G2MR2-5]|uniref:hypothetical protein n=1 Tax=Aliikangiella sp. G2MR2-5 TaxID=2788943 RepID=UPI0018AC65CA|nr:hypothetical protein [Aliikangiella sp. G2MR2-5]